jgi:GNAT superfamily N-acetyltransferase
MDIRLRAMKRDDWSQVAELIYDSTNAWYQAHARPPIFSGARDSTELFCSVYEQLDPGCCLLAEDADAGRIAGSCFYHPRPTHVSIGIMNVHQDYFGKGVARKLLKHVTDIADDVGKPTRLVSSAINLDSFSLYNRAGFVPRAVYQDMVLKVPDGGLDLEAPAAGAVREATIDDLPAMVELELAIGHIGREDDWRHFIENRDGIWHVSAIADEGGALCGFLASVAHPASCMLGPGVARTQEQAAALIAAELNHRRGWSPVWLVPSTASRLVQTMYAWGAANCELHFAQVRGTWQAPNGVFMPTFMPETG